MEDVMSEIHAKPIVEGKLWIVEQDGEKVATLQKQENNKFILSNDGESIWFNKKEEITKFFGNDFFVPFSKININKLVQNECHGFPTRTKPFNAMYDVKRKLPLYTKNNHSNSLYCAGWYTVKFKNWVTLFCPKLVTVEQYESHGPFKSKAEAKQFKCNIK